MRQRRSFRRRQPDGFTKLLNITRNAIGNLNDMPCNCRIHKTIPEPEAGDDKRRQIILVNGFDPKRDGALEERALRRIEDCVHTITHAAKEYKRYLVQKLNARTKRSQNHVGIRDVGDILELIKDNAELKRSRKLRDHLHDLFYRFDTLRGLDVD